jgi:hypothetical protein
MDVSEVSLELAHGGEVGVPIFEGSTVEVHSSAKAVIESNSIVLIKRNR